MNAIKKSSSGIWLCPGISSLKKRLATDTLQLVDTQRQTDPFYSRHAKIAHLEKPFDQPRCVFAFQGAAAGQNFVSQVFGGVGADGFITPVDGAGRLAAMVAEFGIRGDCGSLFVNRIFFSG
jgi:hypothetical protein